MWSSPLIDRNSETLCFCEYIDKDGERNHIIQCCCNCRPLDEIVERLVTCKGVPATLWREFVTVGEDRLRVPWIGGARKIHPITVISLVFPPALLLLATASLLMTVVVFCCIIIILWRLYRKPDGSAVLPAVLFSSALFVFVVFQTLVIPYLEILAVENCFQNLFFFSGAFLLVLGKLRQEDGAVHLFKWLNCYISTANIRVVVGGCLLFSVGLFYTSHLTLTTICHPSLVHGVPFLLPDDCSDVYENFYAALSFVTALHGILCGLVTLLGALGILLRKKKANRLIVNQI